MGLLDWLRRAEPMRIRVWFDEDSQLAGLVGAIGEALERQANVLLVAHFEEALVQAGERLAAAGIAFTTLHRWTPADTQQLLKRRGGSITAVLVRALPDVRADAPKAQRTPDAAEVAVQVADLHVLASENQRVVRFANSLPANTSVQSAISFDHPIMQMFAKPWVKSAMSAMGLKPGKVIDSPMITRGFIKALQKVAKKVTGNVPCTSIQEWLQRNTRA